MQSEHSITGIPRQAFEQFLEVLKTKDGVSSDVIDRLNKTLIEKGDLSEAAIGAALFSNNNEDL
jgi:hypothetical protein